VKHDWTAAGMTMHGGRAVCEARGAAAVELLNSCWAEPRSKPAQRLTAVNYIQAMAH